MRGIGEVGEEKGMRKKEMYKKRWDEIERKKKKIKKREENRKKKKRRRKKRSESEKRGKKEREKIEKREKECPTIGKWNSFYAGCYKELKRLCEELDIKGVNIHSFRRTFAVRQLQNGVSPASVQRMMGHATANLTLEVYCQV